MPRPWHLRRMFEDMAEGEFIPSSEARRRFFEDNPPETRKDLEKEVD